jgi:hypothetical protein
MAPILNADNPDPSAPKARGGKLIIWHGLGRPGAECGRHDQLLHARPANNAIHRPARSRAIPAARRRALQRWTGAGHVDWLTALFTDWVEHGKAPERLVSAKLGPDHRPVRGTPHLSISTTCAVYQGPAH